MKKRKNWLKTTIAMLTLIATVLETGFSSVPVYGSVLASEDSTEINLSADDGFVTEDGAVEDELQNEAITEENGSDTVDLTDVSDEPATTDLAEDQEEKAPDVSIDISGPEEKEEEPPKQEETGIDVSESGISGSGYDSIAVYIDTTKLAKKDRFFVKFTGPDSASYNPVLNDELDKTNGGRYDFDGLAGSGFNIRATSADDVILSYKYNDNGDPVIAVESELTEKSLATEILTAVDDSKISAISGEGYDSVTIEFNTEDISDKDSFKLFVETEADAKVDGEDALVGIGSLTKDTASLKIEELNGEAFKAYVVSQTDAPLETVAEVISVADGIASIDVNGVATKRVYEYEDSKVYVRATLEKADAIPDDAYFCVTPLSEEEAGKYLDALNKDKGEDEAPSTAENTLLYDISFYADETKSEEIEPEEGSVTVSFEFKMDQLTEELNIRESEEIVVTHIKEDGIGLAAEEVADVEASVDSGVVEFTTDSFSVYAINKDTKELKFKPGTARDFKTALGTNVNYGLVANSMNITGHIETNLATKLLESSTTIQSSRNTVNGVHGGTGFTFIGDYKGNGFALKSNNNTGNNVIYTTQGAASRFNSDMGGTLIDTTSYTQDDINKVVSTLITEAKKNSADMFAEPNSYNFSEFKKDTRVKDQYNDFYTIDLKKYGNGDGTYYINFAPGEYGAWAGNPNGLVFVLSKNTSIVLNIPDTEVNLGQNIGFKFTDNPNSLVQATGETRDMSERLIYNMPNATKVNFIGTNDGVFICPNAEVHVKTVSSGWIVADSIPEVGGVEWHNTWNGMPTTSTEEKSYNFEVTKIFDYDEWPEEGFTFKIEKYEEHDGVNQPDKNPPMPENTTVTVYKDTPNHKVSFGTVTFDAKSIYDQGKKLGHNSGEPGYYGGYYMCYMYKITEVIPNPPVPGINYHKDPWFIKLWVNAKEVKYGANTAYKVKVSAKTKQPTDETCMEDKTHPIEFTNTYTPVDFPVEFKGIKKVNGKEANVPDGKFGFTLYNYDRDKTFTTPNQAEKFNVGSKVTFDKITLNFNQATGYNNSDKNKATEAYYYFMIRETTCSAPYTPDGGVYIVKVTAYRNNNKITSATEYYYFSSEAKAKVTTKADDTLKQAEFKICKFWFNNTYNATGSTTIYGLKKLENRNFKKGDVFTFTLTPKTEGDRNAAQEIEIYPETGNEYEFEFAPLTYSLSDAGKEFKYEVVEKQGRDKNISYSEQKYEITVTVSEKDVASRDDSLEVTQDRGTKKARLKFTNTYKAKGEVTFHATKEYKSGSKLAANSVFTFVLEGDNIKKQEKKVIGEDTVNFTKIDYADISAAGTYKYKIYEKLPEGANADNNYTVDGITYDPRIYNIEVTVADDGNGNLVPDIKGAYDDKTMDPIENVNPVFVNDYNYNEIKIGFSGDKILHGRELSRGEFTFKIAAFDDATIAAEDGNVIEIPEKSVKNGMPADRLGVNEFAFSNIKVTEPGTYKFKVTEDSSKRIKNTVYSTDEFIATFVIEDNGKGELQVSDYSFAKVGVDGNVEKIQFINTDYKPGSIPLHAYKELIGRTLEPGQFHFFLKQGDTVIDEADNDAAGNVYFKDLKYEFEELGGADEVKYIYTIEEEIPEGAKSEDGGITYKYNGYTYDGHVEEVVVTVKAGLDENGNGMLTVTSNNANDVNKAIFRNRYDALGYIDLDGTKKITGRKFVPEDGDRFFAVLYDAKHEPLQKVPITKSTVIFGENGGAFEFKPIYYTEAGEYDYTVEEVGYAENVENDETVYSVKVTVTDKGNGTLETAKEIFVENEASLRKVEGIRFVNTFKADGAVDFKAKKELVGATLKGEQFSFELKDASGNTIQTVKNDTGGNVVFKPIQYIQNDKRQDVDASPFIYTINEKITDMDGYKLSEEVYTAVVDLTLDESTGKINIDKNYYKYYGTPDQVKVDETNVWFTNTYEAKGEVELYARKKLVGRDLPNEKFSFTLYDEAGKALYTVKNEAADEGEFTKVTFPKIEYTQADLDSKVSNAIPDGKYAKYYTIREDIPEGAVAQTNNTYTFGGYTYDGSIYNVVVTLEDKGNGKIETDWYAYKKGETPKTPSFWDKIVEFVTGNGVQKDAAFTNEYEAEGAVQLSAKKILTGKTLKANDFTFKLSGKDESGKAFTDTKTNDAAGNAIFDLIKFNDTKKYKKAVEYTYTIEEVVPEGAEDAGNGVYVYNGVYYDNTKYEVKVTVSDTGNGTLKVEASINGGGVTTSAEAEVNGTTLSLCNPDPVVFENNYNVVPITIYPAGKKELAGRALKDGEFEFNMKSAEGNPKSYDETVTNVGGVFTFPPIEYTFDDMEISEDKYASSRDFEYFVNEVEGSLEGITYDKREYKVVVTVTNSKGILSASIKRNDIPVLATEVAEYLNVYNAKNETTFTVEKVVKGTEAANRDFYFQLTGTGIANPLLAVAKNGETVSFAPIKYTLEDIKQADGTYAKTYDYKVAEVIPDDEGNYVYSRDVYTSKVTVTSDGKSGELNIDKDTKFNDDAYKSDIPMKFINKYYASGETIIEGKKEFISENIPLKDGAYTFVLSKLENGEYTDIDTTTNVGVTFAFKPLEFTQDDIGKTYYYRVVEKEPANPETTGVLYDRSIYDVAIKVEDTNLEDGKLNISKFITKKGEPFETCTFINTEIVPNSVTLSANKTLKGKALDDNMFSYVLESEGETLQVVKNKGEKVIFKPIQYQLSDSGKTFNYTIYEQASNADDGIIYDKRVYTAEVKVDLKGKALDVKTVYKLDGTIVSGAEFENEYKSSVDVPLGGEKRLVGFVDQLTPLGTYTFALKDANGQVIETKEVTPTKATDPVKYNFTPLHYTEKDFNALDASANKFTYTVEEVVPKQKAANVSYAKNTYNVTVELYYGADGKLAARSSTLEGVDPATDLIFTNKYEADGDITIDGIKTITGKDLKDGAYTFTLTGEGQNQEVTNNGSTFTFAPIHYEQINIGVHEYEVKESAVTKDGSKYDPTIYKVRVTVNEGEDGKLDISKVKYKKGEDGKEYVLSDEEPIKFNNTFAAEGEIDLEGEKFLKNKPLKSGDFWFLLKDYESGETLQRVTSGSSAMNNKKDLTANSAFKFENLKFTQDDLRAADGSYLKEIKKYYIVEEEQGTKGGYKYSDESYVVEVTVVNNGTEKLDVTKKIVARNKADDSKGKTSLVDSIRYLFADKSDVKIVFNNTYDSECVIDPPILRKQVMGKKIERGEFQFEIEGPGLRSTGKEEEGYHKRVSNGYTSEGSIYGADGKEIPEGEIYVGDIKYKYIDLDIDLETGEAQRTFEYYASEIKLDEKGMEYSDQMFKLTVTAYDDGNGKMHTIPAIADMKWEPLTPVALSDEQMTETFLNRFNQEGSIDLVGIKKLIGRKFTKDDKFEFTLTDDATGASVTRENTDDGSGVPRMVAFNAKDKDGNVDIAFLNYKYGAYELNPDRAEGEEIKFEEIDDTGIHTYTISENNISKAGIKCDTATFKVTVDVQPVLDGNGKPVVDSHGHGQLSAKVTKVEKIFSENNKVAFDFAEGNVFEFTNEFKATGKVDFGGIKFLTDQSGKAIGTEPLLNQYGFALYEFDNAARTTGKVLVDDCKTDADGKFTLSVPEYDEEILKNEKGEYEDSKTLYYRIIELKPSEGAWAENNTIFMSNGVAYDNTEYDIDVTVTFDGTSQLKIAKDIKVAGTGEAVTNINYTNVKNMEYVTVKGTKTWIDDVKDPATRPDVKLNLYSSAVNSGKKVINTYTIKAPETTYKFTTDSAGEPLPAYDESGKQITYRVEELPVNGYVSEQKGYDFYNTKGHVIIAKIDADTKAPLAGATLAIFDGKTEVERWTSGTSAHVIAATLTPGKAYTLREIAAPEGYEVAADITFTVPSDGSDITVTMSDKPIIGSVKLTKRDSSTRATLAGAEFALYSNAGTRIYATGSAGSYRVTSSTSNGVFATDSSGNLVISDLPFGAYYFVETKSPEGYSLSSERLGFTIAKSGAVVEVTFLNKESVGAVRLRKVSSEGERTLEGAVFELYAATPRTAGQAVSSTIFSNAYYRYGTYTTNSSGEIYVSNLPWDDYYFVEVEAPSGFKIATDINGDPLAYTFTINASTSGTTIDLGNIVNDREGEVLGERRPPEEKASGVLGVRSKPSGGVLGTRVGPATGDASAIALWLAIMMACIGTIVWILVDRRRKRA